MKSKEFLFCDYMNKRADAILADPTLPGPRPTLTPQFRMDMLKAARLAGMRDRSDPFVIKRAMTKMVMGYLTPSEVQKGGVSI